jgi:hypothetical protein
MNRTTKPGLARAARNFVRWPWFDKAWFLPAWLLLGLSRLVILAAPFRYLAPWLGTPAGVSPWIPLPGSRREATASSIGRVVRRAARCTPWQSNCFPQAVTARILLGLCGVPYSLFFGVACDAGNADSGQKISAHAWVAAGRVAVTGGVSFGQFTVVGCFVNSKSATVLPSR